MGTRLLPGIVLLAVLLAACEETAELIPGQATPTPTPTPTATVPPIVATPILVPRTLDNSSDAGSGSSGSTRRSDVQLAQSVVQIQIFENRNGLVTLVRSGSGVVIDRARRLILTSYPLVDPYDRAGGEAYVSIVIATNRSPGSDPEPEFEAEIVTADIASGMAVLRAVRSFRGGPLAGFEFDLPEAFLAANGPIDAGAPLRLFSHPGLGDAEGSQAVTVTEATVTGFRGDARLTGRVWMKTDARLPSGATGGPAFDAGGDLAGLIVEPVYEAAALVGQVRPIALASELIAAARQAGPQARYLAPLFHGDYVPGTSLQGPDDGVWVSRPAFAANAIDGAGTLDLFDYSDVFSSEQQVLYYEFTVMGLADGALIEERWMLDGVVQDALSSTYTWARGGFDLVTDRVLFPAPNGIPDGRWTLEVWAGGQLRASADALVGIRPPNPVIDPQDMSFGPSPAIQLADGVPLRGATDRIIAFFDYEDLDGLIAYRWLVYYNGSVVYQSPNIPWTGGAEGSWWIGYQDDVPLAAGTWEFELYLGTRETGLDRTIFATAKETTVER